MATTNFGVRVPSRALHYVDVIHPKMHKSTASYSANAGSGLAMPMPPDDDITLEATTHFQQAEESGAANDESAYMAQVCTG